MSAPDPRLAGIAPERVREIEQHVAREMARGGTVAMIESKELAGILAALRAAEANLARYGNHMEDCALIRTFADYTLPRGGCDCGWAALGAGAADG